MLPLQRSDRSIYSDYISKKKFNDRLEYCIFPPLFSFPQLNFFYSQQLQTDLPTFSARMHATTIQNHDVISVMVDGLVLCMYVFVTCIVYTGAITFLAADNLCIRSELAHQ